MSSPFKGPQQPHRTATIKDDGGPGPGQYGTEHFASVGAKVSDSRKPQSASYSFGSSQRDAFAKTFTDRRTDRAGGRPNFVTSNVQYHATEGLHSVGSARSPLRPRSPAFSMGRATRDSVSKAYLKGQEHLKPNTTTASSNSFLVPPGPTEVQRGNSRMKNTPRFAFGTGSRDAWYKTYADKESARPGARPSTLTASAKVSLLSSSIGEKSSDSRRPTTPSFSFGSSKRDGLERAHGRAKADVAYLSQKSSLGDHEGVRGDSRKIRAPSFGFGSSTRDSFNKLAAKVRPGERPSELTRGATVLDPMAGSGRGIGRQVDSKRQTLPSYGFGTSSRDHASRMVVKPHF